MNRETYEEIRKQILHETEFQISNLESLAHYFGVFNPKTPLNGHKTALKPLQKTEMRILKEIPANGISMRIGSNGLETKKYGGKLLPCEVKDCLKKANPDRKCPSCTKRVCARHLRGKVCQECNAHGEK